MSGPQLLAAVIAAIVVTQLAIFTTTVFLHRAPTSARFSLHRGEIDPGWWVVRALVAFRLAHVRHEDVHPERAA
jgi:fatty-acid desaturase